MVYYNSCILIGLEPMVYELIYHCPKFCKSFGVFNKTVIPLALVGYEKVIANSALRISHPTRAHGIIVNKHIQLFFYLSRLYFVNKNYYCLDKDTVGFAFLVILQIFLRVAF